MADQVNPLAEKIAQALAQWHFDEHMNLESEPAKRWRKQVAAVVSPLLPSGDGWKERSEKAEAERDELNGALDSICAEFEDFGHTNGHIAAAQRCIELIRKMAEGDGWISCSRELPEDDTRVWVWNSALPGDGDIESAIFVENRGRNPRSGKFIDDSSHTATNLTDVVTHWRPLPSPPLSGPAAKEGR